MVSISICPKLSSIWFPFSIFVSVDTLDITSSEDTCNPEIIEEDNTGRGRGEGPWQNLHFLIELWIYEKLEGVPPTRPVPPLITPPFYTVHSLCARLNTFTPWELFFLFAYLHFFLRVWKSLFFRCSNILNSCTLCQRKSENYLFV